MMIACFYLWDTFKLNFMSIRDLGRLVDYIGSAKNIGSFLVQYIGYRLNLISV